MSPAAQQGKKDRLMLLAHISVGESRHVCSPGDLNSTDFNHRRWCLFVNEEPVPLNLQDYTKIVIDYSSFASMTS